MGHLYRRGKRNIWYLKYYQDGKQALISLKSSNYRIAREKAKLLEAGIVPDELKRKSHSNRLLLPTLLEDFCTYLQSIRTVSSYINECSRLRIIFGDICPSLQFIRRPKSQKKRIHIEVDYLDELTTSEINKFLQYRRTKEKVSPTTLIRDREILHKFFVWAGEHYEYNENPIKAIKRPSVNAPLIRFLEKKDYQRQLKALEDYPKIRTMVAIYIYAGLRREEALWLTHEDIDLSRNMIYVRAKNINGKYWQPKTKKNRAVPISKNLREILSIYNSTKDCIWYFSSKTNGIWHPDTFGHYLADINNKAGLDWTCLDFRHTFGSQLAKRGVSLYKISELMGNSPEICRRHYAAIRTEHMHEDVEFD